MTRDCSKSILAFSREACCFPSLGTYFHLHAAGTGTVEGGVAASLLQQFCQVFRDPWDVPSWGSWFVHLCAAQERT